LNPLDRLAPWRRRNPDAAKLYGAIVAQARLPVFYQSLEVPDTLEGRFLTLSMHLFAVLHRLKRGGPLARDLAQDLTDRFTADMETVLREIGVGDLGIPKKMRGSPLRARPCCKPMRTPCRQARQPSPPPSAKPCPNANGLRRLQAGGSRTI
jgi:hypothetical protein